MRLSWMTYCKKESSTILFLVLLGLHRKQKLCSLNKKFGLQLIWKGHYLPGHQSQFIALATCNLHLVLIYNPVSHWPRIVGCFHLILCKTEQSSTKKQSDESALTGKSCWNHLEDMHAGFWPIPCLGLALHPYFSSNRSHHSCTKIEGFYGIFFHPYSEWHSKKTYQC